MASIARKKVLDGSLYTVAGADVSARASTSDFNGDTIDCRGLKRLSFTVSWTADSGGTRAGRFKLQTTDDPAAMTAPSSAKWVDRTFPSGSYDGDATLSGTTATIANTAGNEQLSFEGGLPTYARLVWDNTTAGTDGAITIWVHGEV